MPANTRATQRVASKQSSQQASLSLGVVTCRHQERGKILLVENAKLGQDLETQKLNLFDINEHLTGELKVASAKMDKLEAQALALQAEVDELKDNHMVRFVASLGLLHACCIVIIYGWVEQRPFHH